MHRIAVILLFALAVGGCLVGRKKCVTFKEKIIVFQGKSNEGLSRNWNVEFMLFHNDSIYHFNYPYQNEKRHPQVEAKAQYNNSTDGQQFISTPYESDKEYSFRKKGRTIYLEFFRNKLLISTPYYSLKGGDSLKLEYYLPNLCQDKIMENYAYSFRKKNDTIININNANLKCYIFEERYKKSSFHGDVYYKQVVYMDKSSLVTVQITTQFYKDADFKTPSNSGYIKSINFTIPYLTNGENLIWSKSQCN